MDTPPPAPAPKPQPTQMPLARGPVHDVNLSGWMVLGSALLIFMILPSKPEGQRFDVPA